MNIVISLWGPRTLTSLWGPQTLFYQCQDVGHCATFVRTSDTVILLGGSQTVYYCCEALRHCALIVRTSDSTLSLWRPQTLWYHYRMRTSDTVISLEGPQAVSHTVCFNLTLGTLACFTHRLETLSLLGKHHAHTHAHTSIERKNPWPPQRISVIIPLFFFSEKSTSEENERERVYSHK